MKSIFNLKASLIVAALLALPVAQAATMSKDELKAAKAVEVKALADAKLVRQVGEARKDANLDKRDADYKVAVEKCDALAGDAKASCLAMAKTQFGKN